MKAEIDLRSRAHNHLDLADGFLRRPDIANLRYAALELRMCLEALAYEMILVYYDQLPQAIKKKWAPKDVVGELVELVPDAVDSRTVYVGVDDSTSDGNKKMVLAGTDHRLEAKWASQSYHVLGNFLHSPSIAQLEDGRDHDAKRIIKAIMPIRAGLEKILSSSVFRTRLDDQTTSFMCKCGTVVRRRDDRLDRPVICIACGSAYKYQVIDGQAKFSPIDFRFRCRRCKRTSYIKFQGFGAGKQIKCCRCGGMHVIKSKLYIEYQAEAAA